MAEETSSSGEGNPGGPGTIPAGDGANPGGGGGTILGGVACDSRRRRRLRLFGKTGAEAASGKSVVFAVAAVDVVGYAAAWKLVVAPRYGLEEEIHERLVGAAVRNPREGIRRMRRRAFFF